MGRESSALRWIFFGPDGLRSGWRAAGFGVVAVGATVAMALVGGAVGAGAVALGVPKEVVLVLASAPVYLAFPLCAVACALAFDGTSRGSGLAGPALRSAIEVVGGALLGGLLNVFGVLLLDLLAASGVVGDAAVRTSVALELADLPRISLWATLFVLAATWEEVVFRGYGFAWTGRALANALRWATDRVGERDRQLDRVIEWVGRAPVLLASCVVFAAVHIGNPGAGGWIGFVNTALAGLWLALAVYRTRALWLPVGMHLGWNATMGLVLGIPVSGAGSGQSGLDMPGVLHTELVGPTWFTGADYGLEGSVGCTAALLVGCLVSVALPARRRREAMAALVPPAFVGRRAAATAPATR